MISRRPRRAVAALTGAALCLLLVPGLALAHAELDTMTPADKSSGPAPAAIVATFTENLVPSKSNLTVIDSTGAVVAAGGDVDSANKKQMTLTLPAMAPSAYRIRWTSTSATDGDLARGVTTFTVVAPSPTPPSPSPTPEPSTASEAPSAPPSVAPSAAASPPASAAPSPSSPPTTSTGSTTDAVIPIVVVLIVLAGLGLWLMRGRGRPAS